MEDYGISSWIVAKLSAEDALGRLIESGFTDVELSADKSALVKAWERDPIAIRQKLASAGIDVPSVHSPEPGRFLDVEDEAARRASIAANLGYFDRMTACGIGEIVIHPTSSADVSTPANRAACEARIRDSLEVLAGRACEVGVRLAVENLPGAGRPGSSMAVLLEAIDGLGDHVGLCLDIGHADMDGLDIVDELHAAMAAEKLFSLHIHDVNPDGKRDHFIPGEGRIDFGAFVAALDAARFEGGRTIEISPPDREAAGHLRQAAAVRDDWEARRS